MAQVPEQVGRALSFMLMSELAKALHTDGFQGQVFTTVGGVVTSRFVGKTEWRALQTTMWHACSTSCIRIIAARGAMGAGCPPSGGLPSCLERHLGEP